jgi:DMSO/TMAO reductase YedYZ molybdopterin-dependent catalytic subunit
MGIGLARLHWHYTGARTDYRTYFTPAEQFYHVDHGGVPLAIAPESWRLQIGGRVARPTVLTLADLWGMIATREMVRYVKCLQCLRDPVGDDVERRWYASSGLWGGLPLSVVLEQAGILAGSTRINYGGRDPSGFFASLPLDWALRASDGLPVMLVVELNGSPLPHCRGGPVRLLVPDALGFKSIKWLSWMCVTDALVPNGWYERGRGVNLPHGLKDTPLKTMARIASVPSACGTPTHPRLACHPAGQPLCFRGYAVSGTRGLCAVRYRVDRGVIPCAAHLCTGGLAAIEQPGNWGLPGPFPAGVLHCAADRPTRWPLPFSWVYWQATFGPLSPGRYRFEVWAVDAEGHEQPLPDPSERSGSIERESVAFDVG